MLAWLLNLGFAGGTETVTVAGPYRIVAAQIHVPGVEAGQIHTPGVQAGQVST